MSNRIKAIILALTAIFLLSTTYAQKIEVKTSKDSILIGEVIELSISYPLMNTTSSLSFSEGDSIGYGFEVLEVIKQDTINNQSVVELSVTNFELDNKFIPPFTVFYGEKKLISNPIPIHISLMQVDTNQPFKDIKPIMKDPFTISDYTKMLWNRAKMYWWIILIGIICISILLWVLLKKRQPMEKTITEQPKVAAHIMAKDKLEELEQKEL